MCISNTKKLKTTARKPTFISKWHSTKTNHLLLRELTPLFFPYNFRQQYLEVRNPVQ